MSNQNYIDLSLYSKEQILNEISRRKKCESHPYKILIMLGAPGSGKGTQGELISTNFCYCKFSSGDIFRRHFKNQTPEGIKAKEIMDTGELLPDDLAYSMMNINSFIDQEECKNGIVFDGFPRNVSHSKYLNNLLSEKSKKIDSVILLKINEDKLNERVSGRLIHVNSGRVYHEIFNPPKVKNKDDITGEKLIKRTDEKILKRIQVYNKETSPLIEYYKDKIVEIKADQSIDQVFNEISNRIKQV